MSLDALAGMGSVERRRLLDDAVALDADAVRRWIEKHPANLMLFEGWDVKDFHYKGLEDALLHRESFWLAPRGSGKSTAVAVFVPAWLAISQPENRDPRFRDLFEGRNIGPHNIRLALTSNSSEKAVSLLWQIKAVINDPRLAQVFGQELAGKRWRDISADTAMRTDKLREATFTALGLGSRVTGGHYDVVVADDWVTEDNARTAGQRERLSNFWKFTVRGTLEPWARIIGAGTRYHPADWYSEIRSWVERGLWAHMRRTPALTEYDGQLVSYWPEVYPVEKLLEIQDQIGAIAFATQYQNEVGMMEGSFFEKEHTENFSAFDALPPNDRAKARTLIALDPAIKAGPRNDWSVFAVVSYVAPYFYVRKILRGQWTQHELLQRATLLNEAYRPAMFGVEVVQAQEWLVQEMLRSTRIPVRPLNPLQHKGKDKIGRASNVRTFFEQGRVFMDEPTAENGIQRLIDEMLAFPTQSTTPGMDDCVDALVWALTLSTLSRGRLIRLAPGSRRRLL